MSQKVNNPDNTIAFQGIPGAYSEMACLSNFSSMETLACPSFEQMISSVQDNKAKLAMVPVENSTAGRVADIHHLLPESGLFIIGETFFRVNHMLLGPKGSKLENLEKRETPKGTFLFYKVNKKGKSLKELLPQMITNLIIYFPWKKSQKWGKGLFKWVRPLKGINVLYNNKVIKLNIGQKEWNIEKL